MKAMQKYDVPTQHTILTKAEMKLESLVATLPSSEPKREILSMILTVVTRRLSLSSYAPSPTQATASVVTTQTSLNATQKWLLDAINATRGDYWLSILGEDSVLQNLAQSHSEEMGSKNYFSHTNLAWNSALQRLKNSSYKFWYMWETLANNASNPDTVIQGRLNSKIHKDILLNPKATEVWIWYTKNWDKWTALFATPL